MTIAKGKKYYITYGDLYWNDIKQHFGSRRFGTVFCWYNEFQFILKCLNVLYSDQYDSTPSLAFEEL